MIRAIVVSGQDGDLRVSVKLTITTTSLCRDEVERIVREGTRALVNALAQLPYSDFGVENLKIKA